jgi:hypothetical protein
MLTYFRDQSRARIFQVVNSTTNFILLAVLVIAAELTINWNNEHGVHNVDMAGQLIPLVIGIATFLRVCYMATRKDKATSVQSGANTGAVMKRKPYSPPYRPVPRWGGMMSYGMAPSMSRPPEINQAMIVSTL